MWYVRLKKKGARERRRRTKIPYWHQLRIFSHTLYSNGPPNFSTKWWIRRIRRRNETWKRTNFFRSSHWKKNRPRKFSPILGSDNVCWHGMARQLNTLRTINVYCCWPKHLPIILKTIHTIKKYKHKNIKPPHDHAIFETLLNNFL